MDTIRLNNGQQIPAQGYGVSLLGYGGSCGTAVSEAFQAGHRLIDMAEAYFGETDVGEAIQTSGIPREEIFVTSRLWMPDYSYEAAKKSIDDSLEKLGLEYMDLYLLHQPCGDAAEVWKALEEGVRAGKIKSIGVSDHTVKMLSDLIPKMEILPAVDQIECNPFSQQKELRRYLDQYGIRLEAWNPLGHTDKEMLPGGRLVKIAEKYSKSVAQVILRWHLQEGIIAIPKATSMKHTKANLDIFDFMLTDDEMEEIRAMDKDVGSAGQLSD